MPTSRSNNRTILITIGDPAGIGPEVAMKALASHKISGLANFLIIGDGSVIDKIKKCLNLKSDVPLLDLKNASKGNGRASIEYIDEAIRLLKDGRADALVTGPVSKSSIMRAGVTDFKGHTEYLAERAGAKDYAMMFVGDKLKVTLVTRHIALKDIPKTLSIDSIYRAIVLTHKYLKKYFSIRNPKIGVAGLNPHAGEVGLFGGEEGSLITPAINKASEFLKARISGPLPPDIIFYEAFNKKFDAVISMYHDQALIPFKLVHFKNGVNLTLGLPFIRTSPDHGTAFAIAGKGIADPSSMIEAIRLARRLANKR